jgi:uroporphyrinogen-III synthase
MRRLFVLRPEPAARTTLERAARLGLDAVAMPLFEVAPLAWQPPDPGAFDGLLLTSANALRCGGEGLEGLRGLKVYAVGEATAAAARGAGFGVAATGDGGVERLLDSIDADLNLLHLSGDDRISLIPRQPVSTIPVYRAVELPMPQLIGEVAGEAVAIHSPRAGKRFAALVAEAGINRGQVRIAAISPPAADAAGDGWDCCEAAPTPDDAALLALAARLCDKAWQR